MDEIPFIDWNGNGRIDPADMAISLAMAEEAAAAQEEDDDDIQ